jgi:allantoin racemase
MFCQGEGSMQILLINPNTTQSFTDRILNIANRYASPGTFVSAMTSPYGPRSIECVYDEILSSMGTLEVAISNLEKFDAFIIACYSDHPAISALREITEKPVLGIAEASMYMACMAGKNFSIVTTNTEWEPLLWDAVRHYELAGRCASIRSTGMPVLALESASPEETYNLILSAAKSAVEKDGAEVICLGCAGMSGLDKKLENDLNIPVIDGVVGALKFLEGMFAYGILTSKRRTYSRPYYKELVGIASIFNKPYLDRQ